MHDDNVESSSSSSSFFLWHNSSSQLLAYLSTTALTLQHRPLRHGCRGIVGGCVARVRGGGFGRWGDRGTHRPPFCQGWVPDHPNGPQCSHLTSLGTADPQLQGCGVRRHPARPSRSRLPNHPNRIPNDRRTLLQCWVGIVQVVRSDQHPGF